MKKFKKTTSALLVAGLTVAGSSYAWANEAIFNSEDETAAEIEPVVTKMVQTNVFLEELNRIIAEQSLKPFVRRKTWLFT